MYPTAKLLKILACPVTKDQLTYDKHNRVLVSPNAELVYPIRRGIPILLATQAIKLEEYYSNKQDSTTPKNTTKKTKKA